MLDIGNAIRNRRERAGLSQLDLALAVGYKNSSDISRVETGKQWPDAAKLSAMALQFGCSVSELFADAEGRPPGTREHLPSYNVQGQAQRSAPQPQPPQRDPLDPPTLDDALVDVRFMLTGTDSPELLAAIAYQGMMTRYATERVCSSLNSLLGAIESLRDEVERIARPT